MLMINAKSSTYSPPRRAKSYSPVWSEAECGDEEMIDVGVLALFLPFCKNHDKT